MNDPDRSTFAGLLELHAARQPDALAFAAPGRQDLTYAELFAQVQQIVARLNQLGVGRGDRAALILPNGPDLAAAFLAIAAGAAGAPLNPACKQCEFELQLADLKPRALVIQAGMDSPARLAAQAQGIPIIELLSQPKAGVFELQGEARPLEMPGGFAPAEDPALLLYTSGATGHHKLVALTQADLCFAAQNICGVLRLSAQDCSLNIMPLFHIHGLSVITASLVAGSSVVCMPGLELEQFFGWLQLYRSTWYTAAATMHQAILSQFEEQGLSGEAIQVAHLPLRLIRSASGPLPPLVAAGLERILGIPMIEAYGMTEAAPQISSNPLPPRARKPGSVGLAAGPEIAIMDEAGRRLPVGEAGEVVIRGRNVITGYANDPELNRTAFTDGWLRTGDQGYLDEEGYLFITGRLKEIINRGGEKVSPREVDEALLSHPAVKQAAAFATPHATLGEDVVAAIVLKAGAIVSARELRAFAAQRLAPYKTPSQVLLVDQIPKGPAGKLQRIGLYEKFACLMRPPFEPPRSEIERAVIKLWMQVLGSDAGEMIGVQDNFFSLGGDSLQVTRFVSRVWEMFHIELHIGTVFQHPTVGELAQMIEELLLVKTFAAPLSDDFYQSIAPRESGEL